MLPQHARGWRKGFALALASTVISLLCLEGALRLYHFAQDRWIAASMPPLAQRAVVPSDDPVLIYEFSKNFRKGEFTTNAYGMADSAISRRKPLGMTRIAIVGDSISANYKLLPREVTYPTLLESESVETLNFAVNGYSMLQSQHMASTRAAAFAPDVLIAQLCLNDARPSPSLYTPLAPSQNVYVLNFVRSRLDPNRFAATEYVEQLYDEAGWANVREAFEGLGEFQREHAPVVAVLFPFLYAPAYTNWNFERYHERYRKEAQRAGVAWLDLKEAFLAAGVISHDPSEPLHPGAEGHAVAAREIAEALRALELFERSGAGDAPALTDFQSSGLGS